MSSESVVKEKSLSPREALIKKIEELTPGQAVSYTLPETYGSGLAVITLNPDYPGKGRKKYIMLREGLVNGKPSGQRKTLFESDKSKELASWIMDRAGKPFTG